MPKKVLKTELITHLDCEKHESKERNNGNSCEGSQIKKIKDEFGETIIKIF
jgi:hypothetical protein